MSDFDASQFLSGVGDDGDGDSDLVRLLRSKVKDAAKQLKTVTDELGQLKTAQQTATLDSTWNELKVPEAVRKFYAGEPTADAVKAWFEENKAVFNLQSPADANQGDQGQQGQQPQQQQTQPIPDAQRMVEEFNRAAELGHDVGSSLGTDAILQKAQELKGKGAHGNEAAIDELFALMGLPQGSLQPPRML